MVLTVHSHMLMIAITTRDANRPYLIAKWFIRLELYLYSSEFYYHSTQEMDEAIKKGLEHFGYEYIRPNQERVIRSYLEGKDVLFCSPTGSGKSLTFELAPFVFKCLSTNQSAPISVIVVSPLVALMQFQVETFRKKNINAVYLGDLESQDQGKNILEDISKGLFDVIFASPESLLGHYRSTVTELSKNKALKAIFVDEAHCIKKFGKGDKSRKLAPFRPSYGQLGELRSLVEKKVPMIALTATATRQTRQIIMKELSMENCVQIIVDPDKKNVKYSVEKGCKEICDNFKWLAEMLASKGRDCPRIIVFFRQIKHIVEVFEFLQTTLRDKQYVNREKRDQNGYWNRLFAMFHLTTNEKIKRAVCESFQDTSGLIRVVLCSTSFSMGLDVKCVHTVVHFGPANDLDDYLQESGRAGRNPSVNCNAVLIGYKHCLSSQNITKEMKEFVKRSECRRLALMKPFSENSQSVQPAHDCCDNCAVGCHCLCNCTSVCVCEVLCSAEESTILISIRNSLESQMKDKEPDSSENEEFSSGSDIEEYIRKKPQIIDSSEEND